MEKHYFSAERGTRHALQLKSKWLPCRPTCLIPKENIHCQFCFLCSCWLHKISKNTDVLLSARADYSTFRPQCACDRKTIGSHLKYWLCEKSLGKYNTKIRWHCGRLYYNKIEKFTETVVVWNSSECAMLLLTNTIEYKLNNAITANIPHWHCSWKTFARSCKISPIYIRF